MSTLFTIDLFSTSPPSRILVQPRKLPHGLTVRIGFDPQLKQPVKPNQSEDEELLALKERVEFKLVFFVDENAEKKIPADEGEELLNSMAFGHGDSM